MAAVLTLAMLSMGGIPILSGFFAKFSLFTHVLRTEHIGIVIVAVVNSIISIGYYFKLILAMYGKEPTTEMQKVPVAYGVVAALSILLVIALGLYPSYLLDML